MFGAEGWCHSCGIPLRDQCGPSVAGQLYFEGGKLEDGPGYYADGGELELISRTMDGIGVWRLSSR